MKKEYICPSMKVRKIENESLMAASGLHENSDGTETQGDVDPDTKKTVGGEEALGKNNVWGNWEE